jgi:hypothetical protein
MCLMLIDPYINQGISYHNSPESYLCNHTPLQEGNDALQERNDALLTPSPSPPRSRSVEALDVQTGPKFHEDRSR